jgi:acetylornithine/LysW-gamma-L-lysine aminotransferase
VSAGTSTHRASSAPELDLRTTEAIVVLEDRHDAGLYAKQPIALVRGNGARVWDSDGREYIDCIGGQGVANVGHANPAVAQALASQAQLLATCPNGFYSPVRAHLLDELARIAPPGLERAYLCNSGT